MCPVCGGERLNVTATTPVGERSVIRERVCRTCGARFDSEERVTHFYVMNPMTLQSDRIELNGDNLARYSACVLNRGPHPDYRQVSMEDMFNG